MCYIHLFLPCICSTVGYLACTQVCNLQLECEIQLPIVTLCIAHNDHQLPTLWTKRNVKGLKVFVCPTYMLIKDVTNSKLDAKKMIFIGYPQGTKGYLLFDPTTNSMKVSRNIVFDEKNPPLMMM